MADKLYEEESIQAIADAIRRNAPNSTGGDTFTVAEMPQGVDAVYSEGYTLGKSEGGNGGVKIPTLEMTLSHNATIEELRTLLRDNGITADDVCWVHSTGMSAFDVICQIGDDNIFGNIPICMWQECDRAFYSNTNGFPKDTLIWDIQVTAWTQLETEAYTITGAINELNSKIAKPSEESVVGTWVLKDVLDAGDLPLDDGLIQYEFSGIYYLDDKPEFHFTYLYFKGYPGEIKEFGVGNEEGEYLLYYGDGIWEAYAGERKMDILEDPPTAVATWLTTNGKKQGDPNSGTSSLEMPLIRFVGLRGNDSLSNLGGEEYPVQFMVEIIAGSVQVGDTLQICAMRTFGVSNANQMKKKKLRRFAEYVITEDDLDKRFLTLTVPPTKKVFAYIKHNNMSLGGPGIFYFRIRRPKGQLQANDSGMTVDAKFSNVVPVSMLNIQSDYQEDDEGNELTAVKINVI